LRIHNPNASIHPHTTCRINPSRNMIPFCTQNFCSVFMGTFYIHEFFLHIVIDLDSAQFIAK
jgi:hypothetical protein